MFPVVPDNDTRTEPENVSPERTEAEEHADGMGFGPVTPAQKYNAPAAPASDIFTVPEPAPAKKEPEAPAPATAETFTHYVHLADGRVLRADLSAITEHIGDRYYEDRNTDNERSTIITGVYPR